MDIEGVEKARILYAVEYPGRVQNVDKMMETLGGMQDLSKAFKEKQKLQLKFHPRNFYNKSIISTEPIETTGMLLKIKFRRPKNKGEGKTEIQSAEVVGLVPKIYKFNTFADYQFLPIQKNEKTGDTEYLYEDVIPKDILSTPDWFR
jgi:general transcription factor 3C polypeptide 5 (transcription factor C subunit 1)